ncbi:hypothetical protein [Roseospirillum parvum]|uniref:Uncharacterized protein n=1 Tax=Roseospirillum parvum TaxID=83401 RepID=A0A1G8FBN8_9PROT|nr:hypothetical protein [Roseospirillum parvum]SDH79513.1 hypothetical protein SAMN05421742_11321 [Roseospirillum parvum]
MVTEGNGSGQPGEVSDHKAGGATHTVVVALNDLEALTIVRLVRHLGEQRRNHTIRPTPKVLTHGWSARGALSTEEVSELADTVVLVEMSQPAVRRRIEASGRTVMLVDHHIYADGNGNILDHRNALSSLEQLLLLLDVDMAQLPEDLRQDIPLVAANDRGFIPELAAVAKALGKTVEACVRDIRRRDLTIARLAAENAPHDLEAFDPEKAPWKEECKKTQYSIADACAVLSQALNSHRGAGEPPQEKEASGDEKWHPQARWLDLDGVPWPGGSPRLLLAQVPVEHRWVMADAVYKLAQEEQDHDLSQTLEMLLVFGTGHDKGGPTPRLVEFSGGRSRRDQVAQWFSPEVRAAWPDGIGRLVCYAGGGDSAYFGAEDRLGGQSKALSDLVGKLLDDLLTGNRRVTAWRTTFCQALFLGDRLDREVDRVETTDAGGCAKPPMSALKERVLKSLNDRRAEAPEGGKPGLVPIEDADRDYFLPHLRDLVAPRLTTWEEAQEALREGHAMVSVDLPTEGLSLSVHRQGYREQLSLPLCDLRLHFLYNDVVMVEWTLEQTPAEPALTKEGKKDFKNVNWPDLLDPGHPILGRPLGQVVEFNGKLRFTHSTMESEEGEQSARTTLTFHNKEETHTLEHGKAISRTPFEGWFLGLLCHALGLEPADFEGPEASPGGPWVRALFDDRARVLTSVVVAGGQPTTPAGKADWEVMLARLSTVEPYGNGHAYDSRFALKEFRRGLYTRYREWGSWYAATAHSFMFVGTDGEPSREMIHRRHMPTMYRRMFLISQGYVAVLGAFALEVNDALKAAKESPTRAEQEAALTGFYHYLHRGQLHFTNHIWFEQVSSQVQGRELFEFMSRQTGCQAEYRMVRDEIEQMQAFLAAEEDARKNDKVIEEERRERTLATIALPFALLFALLGSQEVADHFFLWPLMSLAVTSLGFDAAWTWVLASVVALAGSVLVGLAVAPDLLRKSPGLGGLLGHGAREWQAAKRIFSLPFSFPDLRTSAQLALLALVVLAWIIGITFQAGDLIDLGESTDRPAMSDGPLEGGEEAPSAI